MYFLFYGNWNKKKCETLTKLFTEKFPKKKKLNINKSKDIKNIKLENVKKDYLDLLEKYEDNEKITPTLITLFNLLDKNSIKLINLKIAQNKSSIKIKATSKDLLLNFRDFYDENSV